jgi:hypothetical protein
MTDPESGDDLPIIDVRSPAERATDAGRAGFSRLQDRLRDSHLDIAALLWMLFVAGVLAVEIYGAIASSRFESFGSGGWITATLLAASGGYALTFGCMIGIGLAAWVDSGPARGALVMAAVGGAWAIVANVIGVAVVYHRQAGISLLLANFVENRAVAALGELMQGGFGVVVLLVSLMLLTSGGTRAETDPEVAALG